MMAEYEDSRATAITDPEMLAQVRTHLAEWLKENGYEYDVLTFGSPVLRQKAVPVDRCRETPSGGLRTTCSRQCTRTAASASPRSRWGRSCRSV